MAESYDKVIEGAGGLPLVNLFGLNTNKDTSLRGALGVSGATTLAGTVTAIGATASFASPLVIGSGQVIVGALNQVAGPTGVSAPTGSIFLSYSGGTGPATRAFINSNGATGWIAITTAS